jgi:hypothetical protein
MSVNKLMPSTKPSHPPQPEPSPEQKLLAAVIQLEQQVPGGLQISVILDLKRCIEEVEKLFTEHDLPLKDDIVAALTPWLNHAEEGRQFIPPYQRLFVEVTQHVRAMIDKADEKRWERMRRQARRRRRL